MQFVLKRPLFVASVIACAICFLCTKLSLVGMLGLALCVAFASLFVLPIKTDYKDAVLLALVLSLLMIISNIIFYLACFAPAQKYVKQTASVQGIVTNVNDTKVELVCTSINTQPERFKIRISFDKKSQLIPGSTVKLDLTFGKTAYRSGNNAVALYASAYQKDIKITAQNTKSIYYILHNMRNNIVNALPFKSEQTKAFAKAMILGDKQGVDGVFLNAFNTIGLSHVMSVSGMHLLFVVLLIDFLMSLFSIAIKPKAVVACVCIVLFTFISGFAVSCVRSAIMLVIFYLGRISDKIPDSLTSLSVSALAILIVSPYNVTSLSFLLSVCATFGIITLTPCINEFCPNKTNVRFFKRAITNVYGLFAVSLGATLACLPIMAVVFEQVCVISPLVNVVLILPIQILFYIGVLGLIFSFVPIIAPLFSVLGDALYKLINSLVFKIYYIKNITFTADNSLFYIVVAVIILLVIGVFVLYKTKVSVKTMIRYIIPATAVFVVLFIVNLVSTNGQKTLCFTDVGHGNASVLSFDETAVVVDCGGDYYSLERRLKFAGVKTIKLLAITHSDTDHVSSLEKLANTYKIEKVVYPHFTNIDNLGDTFKNLKQSGTEVAELKNDTLFSVANGITLNALVEKAKNVKHFDNKSAVYALKVNGCSVLYTGDMNIYQEHAYLDYGSLLNCDILSVAHHGSKTSSHTEFLNLCSPKYSVISINKNNASNLPSKVIVNRLSKISTVLKTYECSDIIFKINRKGYKCLNEC